MEASGCATTPWQQTVSYWIAAREPAQRRSTDRICRIITARSFHLFKTFAVSKRSVSLSFTSTRLYAYQKNAETLTSAPLVCSAAIFTRRTATYSSNDDASVTSSAMLRGHVTSCALREKSMPLRWPLRAGRRCGHEAVSVCQHLSLARLQCSMLLTPSVSRSWH